MPSSILMQPPSFALSCHKPAPQLRAQDLSTPLLQAQQLQRQRQVHRAKHHRSRLHQDRVIQTRRGFIQSNMGHPNNSPYILIKQVMLSWQSCENFCIGRTMSSLNWSIVGMTGRTCTNHLPSSISMLQLTCFGIPGSLHPQHSKNVSPAGDYSAKNDLVMNGSTTSDSAKQRCANQNKEAASVQQLPQRAQQQRRGKHGHTDSNADQHTLSAQMSEDQPEQDGARARSAIKAEQVSDCVITGPSVCACCLLW